MQDNTENKLDKVDSYLTKFGVILKKHWGKLLIILVGFCTYEVAIWVANLPDIVVNESIQDLPDIYYIDSLSGDTVYYDQPETE